ncbi:hypothetical protein TorRG33x02_225450 [Trema orientale]|uniref:Uncharacterized protein n=1 Tax=Trema orientale TaxID=63057 RepID=A0A2P5E7X9_TREOI|nr:hypothetical protein TorRG33x02_225450 [Trema orientale]
MTSDRSHGYKNPHLSIPLNQWVEWIGRCVETYVIASFCSWRYNFISHHAVIILSIECNRGIPGNSTMPQPFSHVMRAFLPASSVMIPRS